MRISELSRDVLYGAAAHGTLSAIGLAQISVAAMFVPAAELGTAYLTIGLIGVASAIIEPRLGEAALPRLKASILANDFDSLERLVKALLTIDLTLRIFFIGSIWILGPYFVRILPNSVELSCFLIPAALVISFNSARIVPLTACQVSGRVDAAARCTMAGAGLKLTLVTGAVVSTNSAYAQLYSMAAASAFEMVLLVLTARASVRRLRDGTPKVVQRIREPLWTPAFRRNVMSTFSAGTMKAARSHLDTVVVGLLASPVVVAHFRVLYAFVAAAVGVLGTSFQEALAPRLAEIDGSQVQDRHYYAAALRRHQFISAAGATGLGLIAVGVAQVAFANLPDLPKMVLFTIPGLAAVTYSGWITVAFLSLKRPGLHFAAVAVPLGSYLTVLALLTSLEWRLLGLSFTAQGVAQIAFARLFWRCVDSAQSARPVAVL